MALIINFTGLIGEITNDEWRESHFSVHNAGWLGESISYVSVLLGRTMYLGSHKKLGKVA